MAMYRPDQIIYIQIHNILLYRYKQGLSLGGWEQFSWVSVCNQISFIHTLAQESQYFCESDNCPRLIYWDTQLQKSRLDRNLEVGADMTHRGCNINQVLVSASIGLQITSGARYKTLVAALYKSEVAGRTNSGYGGVKDSIQSGFHLSLVIDFCGSSFKYIRIIICIIPRSLI